MFYSLPETVEIDGKTYKIETDFRWILNIIEMLNDAEFSDEDKADGILEMFYPEEKPTNKGEAVKQCFAFMDMGNKPQQQKKGPRLVDWAHDFPYIIAPVNRVLGYEARNAEHIHWWTFLGAYMEIGGDCMFSQIVSMRDKTARGKKLEKHERDWLRRNRDLVELPMQYTDSDVAAEKYWTGGK